MLCHGQDAFTPEIMKKILDTTYEGVIFIDKKGVVRYFNDAMERLSGLRKENVLGKHVSEYSKVTRLHIVLKTGKAETGIKCRVWDNVILNRIPIYKDGTIIGAAGIFLFKQKELNELVGKLNNLESKVKKYEQKINAMFSADYDFADIIGDSELMKRTKEFAKKMAEKDVTIMITGESGTGKEMFAHAIHNRSPRRDGPFVKINCASIPVELIEAELFGYEPGAFTGARKRVKLGKFQMADGGTLFLDEIGDMHPNVQAKVLRVIQEKEVERLGGNRVYKVDVRIIAATNKGLERAIIEGKFRSDLFYRLNVVPLRLPSLKERIDDLDCLVNYFLQMLADKNHQAPKKFTPETMQLLRKYDWPGNIRELLNVVIFAVSNADNDEIKRVHLPQHLSNSGKFIANEEKEMSSFSDYLEDSRRKAILDALEITEGNKSQAAKILNIHRSALYKMMNRLSLD